MRARGPAPCRCVGVEKGVRDPVSKVHIMTPACLAPTTSVPFMPAERLTSPSLAATPLQLRASVRLRSASAAAAVARTLVREAQRPASALATFSAMLLPRTAEGDPERDLAQGIAMQVGWAVLCVCVCVHGGWGWGCNSDLWDCLAWASPQAFLLMPSAPLIPDS